MYNHLLQCFSFKNLAYRVKESFWDTFWSNCGHKRMLWPNVRPLAWSNKFKSFENETKQLKLTLPIINFTTIFCGVSCFQTWRIASNEHLKALSDPILVANGCCDQKLEHLLCLTNSKVSKLKLNKLKIILSIIKLTTIFNSLLRLTTLHIAFKRY